MSVHKLILTSDYEIYGNGSGDVNNCLIKPTEELLSICDTRNIRMCFFVDVCEIWAFEALEKQNPNFNHASLIKNQLIKIIQSGHDIQLHLHPQWIGAKYVEQKWNLNYQYWRLVETASLDFGEFGKGVLGLLNKGKTWLENLIMPIDSKYLCKSFRAGAWCIQPEEDIIESLKRLEFKKESSVAKGLKFEGRLTYYDFTSLKDYPNQWPLGLNLRAIDSQSGLLEIPIASAKAGLLDQLKFAYLKRKRKHPVYPNNSEVRFYQKESSSQLEKIKRHLFPGYRMLDFASGSTFEELKFITEYHIKKHSENSNIIAISHPKNFGVKIEFENYLNWCDKNDNITFEYKNEPYFWR
ncbi:MAG: hypothetical protein RLN79_12080 [Cytophagales bacterium]